MRIKNHKEVIDVADNYKVISYDIFDTLIYRKYINREEVQKISAQFLASYIDNKTIKLNEIISQRHSLTELLKDSLSLDTQEPSLNQVFERILTAYGLSGNELSHAVQNCVLYELELEKINLSPIHGVRNVLNQLNQNGRILIAISDMYFVKEHIESILELKGLLQYFDKIYVSATCKKTKQTTDLFSYVIEDLGCEPNEIVHIGDNYKNDYKNADKVGIQGMHYSCNRHVPKSNSIGNLGSRDITSLISELSIGYVIHVFMECHRLNIKKIFFLTRDATIFKGVTDYLLENDLIFKELLERIKYDDLQLSRITTAFLSIPRRGTIKNIFSACSFIFGDPFTLQEVLDLLEIRSDSDFASNPFNSLLRKKWNKKSIDTLVKEIRISYHSLELSILKSAKLHAETTFNYLIQEGVVGNGKVALVDLGYNSTSICNLRTYLHREADEKLRANTEIYDFLLIGGPLHSKNHKLPIPFTKDWISPRIPFNRVPIILRGNFSWFECFFADRSKTPLLKYRKNNADQWIGDLKYKDEPYKQPIYTNITKSDRFKLSSNTIICNSERYVDALSKMILTELSDPNDLTIRLVSELEQGVGPLDVQHSLIIKSDLKLRDLTLKNYRKNVYSEIWYAGSIVASKKKYLAGLLYFQIYIYLGIKYLSKNSKILMKWIRSNVFKKSIAL